MAKNDDFNSVNPVNQPSEKICKGKCGTKKPLSAFNNNRTKKDGKQEICRECQSDFMKDYNARKAYERRQELTAGDVQLDPAPGPIVKKELPKNNPALKVGKVKLPDKKVSKRAEKADPSPRKVNLPGSVAVDPAVKKEVQAIVKDVAAMPRADRPLHLTGEEKAILIASLDRHVAVIERIIEKLSA